MHPTAPRLFHHIVVGLLALTLMPACGGPMVDGKPTNDDMLVMYGSSRCGICHSFRRQMARDAIAHTFVDVNTDAAGQRAMWSYVRQLRPRARSIRFPVIVRGRRILISPNYRQFQKFYAKR